MRRTLVGLGVALATVLGGAPSASAAPADCPGSFQVQHNDRIGAMQLPKGPYVITVLDTATMGCTEATRLFSEFLEDWDGRLPRPWVATVSTRTFRAGRGSSVGFRVAPDANPVPPTPPEPPSSRVCPGYFRVLHNDRIGSFAIPKGRYRITLLSYAGVGCSRAARYLQAFLQDYNGVLPRPWLLDPGTATFSRGHRQVGFRIKPYVPDQGGGGGGRHPSGRESRCPATFRVLNDDRIGALRLKRGSYNVWVTGLGCPRSSRLLAGFLQDVSGVLPSPWVLEASSATFKRGSSGNVSFRVKAVGG